VFGPASVSTDTVRAATRGRAEDPSETLDVVFGNHASSPEGLTGREATRRLTIDGPNELTRRGGRQWPRELLAQFTQPLALLLIVAAILAAVSGSPALAAAIVAVIILNAVSLLARARGRSSADRVRQSQEWPWSSACCSVRPALASCGVVKVTPGRPR